MVWKPWKGGNRKGGGEDSEAMGGQGRLGDGWGREVSGQCKKNPGRIPDRRFKGRKRGEEVKGT